jgi:hypothetical protein
MIPSKTLISTDVAPLWNDFVALVSPFSNPPCRYHRPTHSPPRSSANRVDLTASEPSVWELSELVGKRQSFSRGRMSVAYRTSWPERWISARACSETGLAPSRQPLSFSWSFLACQIIRVPLDGLGCKRAVETAISGTKRGLTGLECHLHDSPDRRGTTTLNTRPPSPRLHPRHRRVAICSRFRPQLPRRPMVERRLRYRRRPWRTPDCRDPDVDRQHRPTTD